MRFKILIIILFSIVSGYSATLPKPSPTPAPRYSGLLETVDCNNITGHAQDLNNPKQIIKVSIYINGVFSKTVSTNASNKFITTIPPNWKNGQRHSISVKITGTTILVPGNPKIITCVNPTPTPKPTATPKPSPTATPKPSPTATPTPAPLKINLSVGWNAVSHKDMSGYKIHWGTESKLYKFVKNVGNSTTATINIDKDKIYYIAITAYITNGTESLFSKELVVLNGVAQTTSKRSK